MRAGRPATGWKLSYTAALVGVALVVLVVIAWLANRTAKPSSSNSAGKSQPGPGVSSTSQQAAMVAIPPGHFQMGSPASEQGRYDDEGPQHDVQITRGFSMDATEVTSEAYRAFVLANAEWQKGRAGSQFVTNLYLNDWSGNDYPSGKGNHPVAYVSWYAAHAYCTWAGKRLPTEAEWEYAARAGTTTAYWWGDNLNEAFANNSRLGTVPVGARERTNGWGLSDILGNVWEWTSTLYRPYPYRADDGREDPNGGGARVFRGSSWTYLPRLLRAALRSGYEPAYCSTYGGFRCVQWCF